MKIKKKDIFFEILENMVDIVVQVVDYFFEYVFNFQDVILFINEMKKYEFKCDDYVYMIIMEFNKMFIMLIECDDIMELIIIFDDVLDGFEVIVF